MTLKLYLEPNYSDTPDRGEGGIRRVTEAMCKYLPEFGIEITNDIRRADITNGHGVMRPLKRDTPFVSSCHGLYWQDYDWQNWAHQVNGEVVRALISANAITAPSFWVANALTRGLLRRPHVVYHGVDSEEWNHKEPNEGYILWNKGRADPVSNPADMLKLAGLMPEVNFVTTFGVGPNNVKTIGNIPLPEMKRVIQRAGIYLCTARETFGIGTLEALAAGVPVVGWDYGGQSEIIRSGRTGELVPFGDYDALVNSVGVVRLNREGYSKNAIEDARERWQWRPRIAQYAQIFHGVYNDWHKPRPEVSIIVPCHNLGKFLPDCLDSVMRQPFKSWECLIIDDASNDNTPTIAQDYAKRDARFRYIPTGENIKLSRVLSLGAQESNGKYLVNLDADNLLPEDALTECARELDSDPDVHIVYGALDLISYEGGNRQRNPFPGAFNWRAQIAHLNQIHSGAMMRREVAIELGGWRERDWRAEDAHFWSRATSYGFRAKKITERPTLIYRVRADSKGALEFRNDGGDGNWLAWIPFATASNAQDGIIAMQEKRPIAKIETVPFSTQCQLGIDKKFWPVFHRQHPLASVIVPCSHAHRRYVIDALDSLVAQDFGEWEAIVIMDVDDSNEIDDMSIPGAPYARIVGMRAPVGQKRNSGAQMARGELLYFLDADDYLLPGALRKMIELYISANAAYIFTDYIELWESWEIGQNYFANRFGFQGDKEDFKKFFRSSNKTYTGAHGEKFDLANADANTFGRRIYLPEYDQFNRMQAITNVLISKRDFLEVGGFDRNMPSREDWDFLCKLAINGKCGKRLDQPGFVYRLHTGTRREIGLEKKEELVKLVESRYGGYYLGNGKTMSECCGSNSDAILAAKRAVAYSYGDSEAVARYTPSQKSEAITSGITQMTERLEFVGTQLGPIPFMGGNGRQYRGANSVKYKYIDAHPEDVARLVSTGQWQRVSQPEHKREFVESGLPIAAMAIAPPNGSATNERPAENAPIGELQAPPISNEELEQFGLEPTPNKVVTEAVKSKTIRKSVKRKNK